MSFEVTILEPEIIVITNENEEVTVTTDDPSPSQTGITFEDEGAALGTRGTVNELDFVGSGVSAARTGDKVTVTITSGGGSGDVTGPSGATADDIATFNGATGKTIKDGGSKISDLVPTSRTVNLQALSSNIVVPTLHHYYRAGQYLTGAVVGIDDVNTTLTANTLRAYPIVIGKSVTVTEITLAVTAFVAGSTFRIGIYTDNGSMYPDALVAGSDVGTYDSASNAIKSSGVVSIALTPGLYWLAINASAGPNVRGFNNTAFGTFLGYASVATSAAANTRWSVALTYAPMPSTFTAGATLAAATIPKIGLLI